jgi:hypothetical protein
MDVLQDLVNEIGNALGFVRWQYSPFQKVQCLFCYGSSSLTLDGFFTADSDTSGLDVLRGLVTEIGNALGFVRMVANGAAQHCNDAAQFAPQSLFTPPERSGDSSSSPPEENGESPSDPLSESDGRRSFVTAMSTAGFQAPTVLKAAQNLDEAVGVLREGGAKDSAHFLRMLVRIENLGFFKLTMLTACSFLKAR